MDIAISPRRRANLACLDTHLRAENAHDMAGTLATLAPDCRFEDVAMGRTFEGHAGARAYYELWWSAFAVTVESGRTRQWIADDLFVAEATYVGRHVGTFLGIPPTGLAISLPFVVFVSFRDGRFAGERFYYDMASLTPSAAAVRQLTATPD